MEETNMQIFREQNAPNIQTYVKYPKYSIRYSI